MPWKECSVVDERLRFVAQLLDGEAMSEVCHAFGISRKTLSSFRIPKPTVRGSLASLVHRPLWRYGIVLGRLL